jgi:REP element-mobilizing transposase RayT
MPHLPQRSRFHHQPPAWVDLDSLFFITVCCRQRGISSLNNPLAFNCMVEACEFYIRSNLWSVEMLLAMPDHWHALIRFQHVENMEAIIRNWKRYVAKRTEIVWQDGFFEHRLRSRQSANEKWHYIHLNPIRKGLVAEPHIWPYAWYPPNAAR